MGEDLEIIQEVPISQIDLVAMMRRGIDEEKLESTACSMAEVGLLQPVRLVPGKEKFGLVDGFHRTLCRLKLGFDTVPAIIEKTPLPDAVRLQKAFISNVHHVKNTPIEMAEAIDRLMQLTGCNATTAAKKLGLSDTATSNLLKLLKLPEPIREQVHRGEISASAATRLVDVADGETQQSLAEQVAAGKLTRDALIGKLKAARRNGEARPSSRTARMIARLDAERTVTVTGDAMDIDAFIQTLEELLAKARKARTQGVEVATFAKMLSDQAKAGS
jgi:ParB family transcriptional regulator, chromosome partitioning protein